MSKEKQRVVLQRFKDEKLRVTDKGVVEWCMEWRPWRVLQVVRAQAVHVTMPDETGKRRMHTLPICELAFLWWYLDVVSEDTQVIPWDDNPFNHAPSNWVREGLLNKDLETILTTTKAQQEKKRRRL